MNLEKKYSLQKKRLDRANQRILELEAELDNQKSDAIRVRQLINELETMKKEWQTLIDNLEKKKEEYSILIEQIRILKKSKRW